MRVLWALSISVAALTLLDCLTTYVALTIPAPRWNVSEANVISAWLFGIFGLGLGLIISGTAKFAALYAIFRAQIVPLLVRQVAVGCFGVLVLYAVINNLNCIRVITGG